MSTNADLVSSIRLATVLIDRHATLVVLLFGTVGNLLNLAIVSERSLRHNPCSTYLWWSSLSSIVYLWSGLPTRVLGGYGIVSPNQNTPLCKTRLFIVITIWAITLWAMAGASIDRYLSTHNSPSLRRRSTVRTARQILAAILAVSVAFYVEIFYCYEASVPNVPVACYTQHGPCRGYNDWMNIVYNILIPCGCMAVFSVLTVRNIQARVVHPVINPGSSVTRSSTQPRTRQKDRTLTSMLLAQVRFRLAVIVRHHSRLEMIVLDSTRSLVQHAARRLSHVRQRDVERC